jgi:3-oxoacyl-[acyl-carrier protein] reductase
MSLPLSGKVAIVTGSSRNIGAAIVKRLAADGASVVVNYNGSEGAANELVEQINTEGNGQAIALKGDMSSVADANKLVEETVKHFGKLDIVVLNAGLMNNKPLDSIDEKLFDDTFNINVKVPLFMVKTASKHMKAGSSLSWSHISIRKSLRLTSLR